MTRIIAGIAGGRRLIVPESTTRPTSDRAREALFSSLDSLLDLRGVRILDLYAGSGAVGLEALSRGAEHALLVESDPKAVAAIASNMKSVALPGALLRRHAVERLACVAADTAYDVAFADPPYQLPAQALTSVLAQLHHQGWLAEHAVVVVERSSRDPAWVWPQSWEPLHSRQYGEATLWYGRTGQKEQAGEAS
ncbi:MAG: 16S rRNA (guanine(966)-N(2))-methyltransferase RsmD [Acidimicrobiales bacterium]|nr:MAG: 16S rRNA (guanine(966)-N(2))-methyltransferase RsmD [Acidimicrobiales bacterium]